MDKVEFLLKVSMDLDLDAMGPGTLPADYEQHFGVPFTIDGFGKEFAVGIYEEMARRSVEEATDALRIEYVSGTRTDDHE